MSIVDIEINTYTVQIKGEVKGAPLLVTRTALAAEYPAVSREVPTIPRDCARVTPVEPAASTTAPFRIRRPGAVLISAANR